MGCSHSDFNTMSQSVTMPSEITDNNIKEFKNSILTSDEIENIKLTWKMIGDEKEFLLSTMIRYIYTSFYPQT